MDTANFVEAVRKSGLPFVYSGERLNDENCQKALKKMGVEGTVLGAIVGGAVMGDESLAVTEKGIWYALGTIPKSKGTWFFDKSIIHEVIAVKKGIVLEIFSTFEIELLLWNIEKSKSSTFKFNLNIPNLDFKDSMVQGLEDILKTLTSKTGTEYVSPLDTPAIESQQTQAVEKDPNNFDFEYGDFHTFITLEGDAVVIKEFKVDEKTKIQTLKKDPVTIPRSAIASVKSGRSPNIHTIRFAVGGILLFFGLGIQIHFALGFLALLICIAFINLLTPGTLIIIRKDGAKFTTRLYGKAKKNPEYERFVNAIFK
jgi:hypothetical protein